MVFGNGNGHDDPERLKRIEELKRQADELAGGEMAGWKSTDLTPELEEEFLQRPRIRTRIRRRALASPLRRPRRPRRRHHDARACAWR